MNLDAIVRHAESLYGDLAMGTVKKWKEEHPGRPAVGHLPIYVPRELIHAQGALPVALQGGGDMVDIIRGDACFQSYICHIPRSTVELGLSGEYACLDGVVCPSTCDVIRNLSGIWQLLFPDKMVRYLDLPQSFGAPARAFYRKDLEELAHAVESVGGLPLTQERLSASLVTWNENRAAAEALYSLRAEAPHLVPTPELYLVIRAGNVIPVEEHTELLHTYAKAAKERTARREDRIRVVAVGAFCEQPPLGLLRTLERAGCYLVEDDLQQGARMINGPTLPGEDPLGAVVDSYCDRAQLAATRWDEGRDRGQALVDLARSKRADGVVFMAPSFCDPALLDQPRLQKSLERAQIPFTTFKYAENTGQFQGIHEQAGTFADSIKLWGEG